MKTQYPPSNALLDFNQEVDPVSILSERIVFANDMAYSTSGMSPKRNAGWETKGMRAPVPGSSGCSSLDPSMVGLTGIPVSSSSGHPHSACVNPHAGYATAHPDSVTFLAPDSYLSNPQDSPNEHMGSLYSWSSTSNAEELKPSSSVDSGVCSASNSPFMQSYYNFGTATPAAHPDMTDTNGYTPQQINKWCMESDPTDGSFYQPTASYPAISPLAFPSAEMPSNVYPTLNQSMSTAAEQWFPMPAIASPPSPHNNSIPIPIPAQDNSFLSPSATALSFDSCSVISTSPAPTLSDFESKSSSPPFNPADLTRFGIPAGDGVWRCAHPGCTSQALFRRGCDLRKHFNRHRKHLFCRHEGCPQSKQGGFSSKKDRARHEAKHNPGIVYHVRRIHRRGGSR
ncbi:unnamed protein product [Penicillium manginii]